MLTDSHVALDGVTAASHSMLPVTLSGEWESEAAPVPAQPHSEENTPLDQLCALCEKAISTSPSLYSGVKESRY